VFGCHQAKGQSHCWLMFISKAGFIAGGFSPLADDLKKVRKEIDFMMMEAI
jgi:hypothetical protein